MNFFNVSKANSWWYMPEKNPICMLLIRENDEKITTNLKIPTKKTKTAANQKHFIKMIDFILE